MLRYMIAGLAGLVLAGCTASPGPTPSPSPPVATATPTTPTPSTPSPTPTPTWDAKQTAAVKAVRAYFAASTKIGANPAKYTQTQMVVLLRDSIGGDMIKSNVDSYLYLKKRGYREVGKITMASVEVDKVADYGRGDKMTVTVCQDQTALQVVDRQGKVVASEQKNTPAYLLREYTVRKPPGEGRFRVFGMRTGSGTCGP